MKLFKQTILCLFMIDILFTCYAMEDFEVENFYPKKFELWELSSDSSSELDPLPIPKSIIHIPEKPFYLSNHQWNNRLQYLEFISPAKKFYFIENYDIADLYGYQNYDKLYAELQGMHGHVNLNEAHRIQSRFNFLKHSIRGVEQDYEMITLLCDIFELKSAHQGTKDLEAYNFF